MSTSTATRTSAPSRPAVVARHLVTRLLGAALCLGVAYIHVKDQGGFPGDKSPEYIRIGYYVLEAAGVIAAAGLLLPAGRRTRGAWVLAVGVALGPIVGFVLSRGPGLPNYSDDKGNWSETLGIVSLVVEGLLLVLATAVLARSRRINR